MSRDLGKKGETRPLALLVLPPVYDFAFYDLYFKPFGLLRIGRWLEKAGWDCVFVNSLDCRDDYSLSVLKRPARHGNGTGKIFRQPLPYPDGIVKEGRRFARYGILPESLEKKISSVRKPDIILVSTFMTYWYMGAAEAVNACRKVWKDAPVIAGGVYATLMPGHCLEKTGADHVVTGEAWEFLYSYLSGKGLPCGPASGEAGVMNDPVWMDASVIRLNSGCPMKCRYCASSLLSGFRAGNPDEAFAQVEEHYMRYGTRNFAFYDDALLSGKNNIFIPFLEKIIEKKMETRFYVPNALHIDYLDRETLLLMKRAGFREIRLGFESADPEFHRRNGNKYDPRKFPALMEELRECGFTAEEGRKVVIYILAGLPGQYAGEVRETVNYLKQFNVKISVSEYSPVPGTALWPESVKKSSYPIEDEPLFHNNSLFPMAWEKFTVRQMRELKELASAIKN